MKLRLRFVVACCAVIFLSFGGQVLAAAYGYSFVFPAARRSAVGGYTYADPDNPSYLKKDKTL